MKKRTKVSKKRLDNLLLILLLTAVLLIMSTYAWFTANRTVKIDLIDVQVATKGGLQISADGIDWKTVLSKEDLVNAHTTYSAAVNQLPSLMSPVSTDLTLNSSNGRMNMYFGDVNADLTVDSATYGDYLLTSTLQTDKESSAVTTSGEYDKGYYIAFDFFLKVDSAQSSVYMTGDVEEYTAKTNATATTPDISSSQKGLDNAARVAFIKGSNTADSTATSTVQALGTVGGTVFGWEPNADRHNQNGIANYNGLKVASSGKSWSALDGALANTGLGTANASKTGYNPLPWYGLNSAFTDAVALGELRPTGTGASKVTTLDASTQYTRTNSGAKLDKEIGGLSAGVTKCRAYMWIEGQDVDCENQASGTYMFYSLSFSLDSFNS